MDISGHSNTTMDIFGQNTTTVGNFRHQNSEMEVLGYENTTMGVLGYGNTTVGVWGYENTTTGVLGYNSTEMGVVGYSNISMENLGYKNTTMDVFGYENTTIDALGYINTTVNVFGHPDTAPIFKAPLWQTHFPEALLYVSLTLFIIVVGTFGNIVIIIINLLDASINNIGRIFIINIALGDLCVAAIAEPVCIIGKSYTAEFDYMSAHVLLNLLNELRKRDKMRGLPSILSLFRNEFNKFNNTRARMLDSFYHMTLRLLVLQYYTLMSRVM